MGAGVCGSIGRDGRRRRVTEPAPTIGSIFLKRHTPLVMEWTSLR
ncbi:hypothetical protein SAMN05421874_10796 [Nonomuraea maritima]|uniref:Uncharacterized protein n=1 Tax=Nonomuraea maritima TaxID=683260 RepID=A0A1G9BB42_9ACTN|nr:hypothetical protein SAMN05421874_10796 [Nonomuraea maritima]